MALLENQQLDRRNFLKLTGVAPIVGLFSNTEATPPPQTEALPAFPTTREGAIKALGSEASGIQPDMVRPIFDNNNIISWRVEGFPLNSGVSWDQNLQAYVDNHGDILITDQKIYNIKAGPTHFGVNSNTPDAYVFARTGGTVPVGSDAPANTSYFSGTQGPIQHGDETRIFEQAALMRVPENCGTDPDTAAWQDAVGNSIWNTDVQEGTVDTRWYDPDNGRFTSVRSDMLVALGKTTKNHEGLFQLIKKLPMGYPLSAQEARNLLAPAGPVQGWIMDLKTGIWSFEGFPLKDGVVFDPDTSLYRKGDHYLFDPDNIFNFSRWEKSQWPDILTPGSLLKDTYAFMRRGGDGNPSNTAIFGMRGDGTIVSKSGDETGFEQLSIVPIAGCEDQRAVRATLQADAQNHANSYPEDTAYTINPDGSLGRVMPTSS